MLPLVSVLCFASQTPPSFLYHTCLPLTPLYLSFSLFPPSLLLSLHSPPHSRRQRGSGSGPEKRPTRKLERERREEKAPSSLHKTAQLAFLSFRSTYYTAQTYTHTHTYTHIHTHTHKHTHTHPDTQPRRRSEGRLFQCRSSKRQPRRRAGRRPSAARTQSSRFP